MTEPTSRQEELADRDSGEAQPEYLEFSERLACGHRVEASEDSGGFDEYPTVTEKMVRNLLAFKVRVHNCELTDASVAARRRVADGPPF